MSDIIKIAAAALITALCCVVLRKQTPDLALVLGVFGGVLIFWMASTALTGLTDFMFRLSEEAGLSAAVFAPVIKVIGIAMVAKVAGEFCRDAKESGVAAFLDLAAAATALVSTLPLIRAVLDTISDLI